MYIDSSEELYYYEHLPNILLLNIHNSVELKDDDSQTFANTSSSYSNLLGTTVHLQKTVIMTKERSPIHME